jgi:uncharacterized protein YjbI with pentapeptide repeats
VPSPSGNTSALCALLLLAAALLAAGGGMYFRRVPNRPVAAGLLLFGCSALLLAAVTLAFSPLPQHGFWRDLLLVAYGAALDVLLIGVLLLWLLEKGRRRFAIERHRDEIDDLRGWHALEAAYKIKGRVSRLNRCGVSDIDLSLCYLENMVLTGAKLRGAKLVGCRLRGANLAEAELVRADLQGADLSGGLFWNTDFRDALLWEANLSGALLEGADLRGANLQDADLRSANLTGADLRSVQGLRADQLAGAETLREARLDDGLVARIKRDFPRLFQ